MPRALITAKCMFGKNYDILFDKNFIKFKFGTWATISRLLWFIEVGKTDRKFRAEKLRAEEVCRNFIQKIFRE